MEPFPGMFMLMALIGSAAAAVLAVDEELYRRRMRRKVPPPMTIPSADETAASIERFHAAVRRFKDAEFAWERAKIKALAGRINRT